VINRLTAEAQRTLRLRRVFLSVFSPRGLGVLCVSAVKETFTTSLLKLH